MLTAERFVNFWKDDVTWLYGFAWLLWAISGNHLAIREKRWNADECMNGFVSGLYGMACQYIGWLIRWSPSIKMLSIPGVVSGAFASGTIALFLWGAYRNISILRGWPAATRSTFAEPKRQLKTVEGVPVVEAPVVVVDGPPTAS